MDAQFLTKLPLMLNEKNEKTISQRSSTSNIIDVYEIANLKKPHKNTQKQRSLQIFDFLEENSPCSNVNQRKITPLKKIQTEDLQKITQLDVSFHEQEKAKMIKLKESEEVEILQYKNIKHIQQQRRNSFKLVESIVNIPSKPTKNSGKVMPLDFAMNHSHLKQSLRSSPKKSVHQRWKKLGIVFFSIHRMQRHAVINIDTPICLGNEVLGIISCQGEKLLHSKNKANTNVFNDFVSEMRKAELFVMLAELGSENDIRQLRDILINDPKKFLRSTRDKEHLVNKCNKFGQNAMYMAAKNGNLKVIQFLVSMDADPYLASQVALNVKETPLEVAIRWEHIDCISWMINNIPYSQENIKQCINSTDNQRIKNLLKSKITKQCSFFFCW